jgi:hypothetical protein
VKGDPRPSSVGLQDVLTINWHEFCSLSIAKSIGELSEEADLRPFMDILTKFILEIKKRDGALYHRNRYVDLFFFFCLVYSLYL